MYSFKSPHRGGSNEYTQYAILNKKKKSHLIILNLQPRGVFLGTQEQVRNSSGKRAISVQATEVPLYVLSLDVWVHFQGKQLWQFHFCLPLQ